MTKTITALCLCLMLLTGTQTIQAQDKKAESKTEEQTSEIDLPSLPPAAILFPQEGMIAVEKDGKYGFKELGGKLVIPCKYDDVGSFSGGLAAVELNGKWGVSLIKKIKWFFRSNMTTPENFQKGWQPLPSKENTGLLTEPERWLSPVSTIMSCGLSKKGWYL